MKPERVEHGGFSSSVPFSSQLSQGLVVVGVLLKGQRFYGRCRRSVWLDG
jgi:hypothetical protein